MGNFISTDLVYTIVTMSWVLPILFHLLMYIDRDANKPQAARMFALSFVIGPLWTLCVVCGFWFGLARHLVGYEDQDKLGGELCVNVYSKS